MILSKKTLEKLRDLINEETEYRSGPKLVQFFNELGFQDSYGAGFPSRWMYTDEKLKAINGTPEIDKCIKNVLAPINFVGRFADLDAHIRDFNEYLVFDKWRVVRKNDVITFEKLDKVDIDEATRDTVAEDEFLKREFTDVDVSALGLEGPVTEVLQFRIREIEKCFAAGAPLAVILLAGSTLEGILLGLAAKHPKAFNSAKSSPKDGEGRVRRLQDWTLASFIDVAGNLGLIQRDTQKFSHSLRDFRNYIHPFEQMSSGFDPREYTAKLCLQVLKAAISEIAENLEELN